MRRILVICEDRETFVKWCRTIRRRADDRKLFYVSPYVDPNKLRGLSAENTAIVYVSWPVTLEDKHFLILGIYRRLGSTEFMRYDVEGIRTWLAHGDSSPHVEAETLRDQEPPADLHDRNERDAADQPHRDGCACCALPR